MKVTLAALISPVTQEALSVILTQPVSFKVRHNLTRIQESVGTELETFDKTKLEMLEKFVVKDGDDFKSNGNGGLIFKSKKGEAEFVKEWNELVSTEITIKGEKIDESSLDKIEMSVVQGIALGWLIESKGE
mgnify:CR=1 FL=1